MNFLPVTQVLTRHLGLDPHSLGSSSLRAALGTCMRAANCTDPEAYALLLERDPRVLERLIEEIVVAETWFFRGGDLFWFLAEQIRLTRRERPGRPFRVLSIPCSTGEEAYSLAIAALELGLSPGSWSIDAVDISRRALLAAGQGQYGSLSFRQTEPGLRERYFRKIGERWEIRPEPREGVRFLQGNLLNPTVLALERPYDLVFCRNVFIYLTSEARRIAANHLARLLRSEGLLCTSVTETLPATENRFTRWGPPAYGLYRRTGDRPSSVEIPTALAAAFPPTPPRAPVSAPVPAPVPATVPTPPAATVAPVSRTLLDEARRWANEGRLEEALAACMAIETAHGPSADLFALLGVIHQGRGEVALAHEAFRKALYLEANHGEALTHLVLLAQQRGDQRGVQGLQHRIARLGRTELSSEESA
jgi:chemotaxis protein methyltransferase WspC